MAVCWNNDDVNDGLRLLYGCKLTPFNVHLGGGGGGV
jgi:hypothetical protein